MYKPPEEQLAETRARLAAAQRQFTASERDDANPLQEKRAGGNVSQGVMKSIGQRPSAILGIAAVIGFALGAVWRA